MHLDLILGYFINYYDYLFGNFILLIHHFLTCSYALNIVVLEVMEFVELVLFVELVVVVIVVVNVFGNVVGKFVGNFVVYAGYAGNYVHMEFIYVV